jgi:signal transduction histidine kinase
MRSPTARRPIPSSRRIRGCQPSTSVSNKGLQIPRESQKRLFAPFMRGAIGAGQQGLELGLYIVAEIARAHGGTIEVTSTKDERGSAFVCRSGRRIGLDPSGTA